MCSWNRASVFVLMLVLLMQCAGQSCGLDAWKAGATTRYRPMLQPIIQDLVLMSCSSLFCFSCLIPKNKFSHHLGCGKVWPNVAAGILTQINFQLISTIKPVDMKQHLDILSATHCELEKSTVFKASFPQI